MNILVRHIYSSFFIFLLAIVPYQLAAQNLELKKLKNDPDIVSIYFSPMMLKIIKASMPGDVPNMLGADLFVKTTQTMQIFLAQEKKGKQKLRQSFSTKKGGLLKNAEPMMELKQEDKQMKLFSNAFKHDMTDKIYMFFESSECTMVVLFEGKYSRKNFEQMMDGRNLDFFSHSY